MSSFNDRPEAHWFLDPMRVQVSPEALALAVEFAQRLPKPSKGRWVICFEWADTRRYRLKGSNEWRDLGPGIDITAYADHEIPKDRKMMMQGIQIAFRIADHVFEKAKLGQIVADPAAVTGIALL